MIEFLRRRRRAKVVGSPFPDGWRTYLETNVALWFAVPDALRPRLEDDLRLFIAERDWEPCGGLVLDEEMCAMVAAQACVLTLGRSVDSWDHLRSILIYPAGYTAPDVWEDEVGIVTEGEDERVGEASERGIVVLSWQELAADARHLNGRNLVLHEMAHQLDFVDVVTASPGAFEGGREEVSRQLERFFKAYKDFRRDVDAGRRVRSLDPYGAEDEAEFFAVATEAFFERGHSFKLDHPGLYDVLVWFYHLDPVAWPRRRV
jgi:hypothetical protein